MTISTSLQFVWRQLKGPQITAVIQGTLAWVRDSFERKLEYFKNFSLTTANEAHLTMLGLVSGFTRCLVAIPRNKMFWFTDGPFHNNEHGVSDLYGDLTVGGKFSDAEQDRADAKVSRLPAEVYRYILQAYLQSSGQDGSLVLLEDITKACYKAFKPSAALDYHLTILEEAIRTNMDVGDLVVWGGNVTTWGEYVTQVNGIYTMLEKELYGPDQQVFFDTGNST